jgi:hypothetical protein
MTKEPKNVEELRHCSFGRKSNFFRVSKFLKSHCFG